MSFDPLYIAAYAVMIFMFVVLPIAAVVVVFMIFRNMRVRNAQKRLAHVDGQPPLPPNIKNKPLYITVSLLFYISLVPSLYFTFIVLTLPFSIVSSPITLVWAAGFALVSFLLYKLVQHLKAVR